MKRALFLILGALLAASTATAGSHPAKSNRGDAHPPKVHRDKSNPDNGSHPKKSEAGKGSDAANATKAALADDSNSEKSTKPAHAAGTHHKKEHFNYDTLPDIEHERVDYWVAAFSKMHDYHKKIAAGFARKAKYQGLLEKKLRQRGMPQSLIYLAFEESAFNPDAGSRQKAVGIWQLTPATARLYGLKVTKKIDERKDINKETDAAIRFLDHLHRRFGCWYLAAAAYDSGEHRIARLMKKKFGREKGHDHDYYRIWDDLPGETRDYVPAIIALKRISRDPSKYGF